MLKFKIIFVSLFMISSMVMINCSDDSTITPIYLDTSDFRYPFKDGSTWSYTITTSVSDIRPDSIIQYFNHYPTVISGTASILYDTVINSVLTKCFLDEFTSSGTLSSNRYYYINNDTALILFASRQQSQATGILPLRKIKFDPALEDVHNDIIFNNDELKTSEDTILITLKYPMETGTTWTIYPFADFTMEHKYLGFENVNLQSGVISCMKELTTMSILPNLSYYNFYSKSGLVKTHWIIDDNPHTTVYSPDGDGTYDITSELNIMTFNIPD